MCSEVWQRTARGAILPVEPPGRPTQRSQGDGIPIILDCDTGTDDAVALLLALASPELDVRAITVAGGNVGLDRTLTNTLALTRLAGSAVPVHSGADRPLLGAFVNEPRVHGVDGLGGIVLPDGGAPAPGLAADAIRHILRTSPEPVTLVGIAPVTNLALALMTEPDLAANISQIVLMSGAWAEGNATPAAEFNALNDPEALTVLLACGRPVVFATLELTAQALVTPERLAVLRAWGRALFAAACDIQAMVPLSRRLAGRAVARPLRGGLAGPAVAVHISDMFGADRPGAGHWARPHGDRPLGPHRRSA